MRSKKCRHNNVFTDIDPDCDSGRILPLRQGTPEIWEIVARGRLPWQRGHAASQQHSAIHLPSPSGPAVGAVPTWDCLVLLLQQTHRRPAGDRADHTFMYRSNRRSRCADVGDVVSGDVVIRHIMMLLDNQCLTKIWPTVAR
jgi:hypothetical protein